MIIDFCENSLKLNFSLDCSHDFHPGFLFEVFNQVKDLDKKIGLEQCLEIET